MSIPETLLRSLTTEQLDAFIAQAKRTRRRFIFFSLNARSIAVPRSEALALAKNVRG